MYFGVPDYVILLSFFLLPIILLGIFYFPEKSAARALKNHGNANMLIAFTVELTGLAFMILVLYTMQSG